MPIDNRTVTALQSSASRDFALPPGFTMNGGVPLAAQGLFAPAVVGLGNTTSAVAAFPAVADSLYLAGKTMYIVNGLFRLTHGSTAHTTSLTLTGLASAATFTSVGLVATGLTFDGSTQTALTSKVVEAATATVVVASAGAVRSIIKIEGVIITNAAGNITPQLTFSADPTGTNQVDIGSYFYVSRVGNNVVTGTGVYS